MATFTLDKDNLLSDPIALAESPMQISVVQDTTSWTGFKTKLQIWEETDTPGTYVKIWGYTISNPSNPQPFNLKAKNYKVGLEEYSDTDSVDLIVS